MMPVLILLSTLLVALLAMRLTFWINGGSRYSPLAFAAVGLVSLNLLGGGLIASGITGRPFKGLEVRYGLFLWTIVMAGGLVFLGSAWVVDRLWTSKWAGRRASSEPLSARRLEPSPVVAGLMLAVGAAGIAVMILYFLQVGTVPLVAALAGVGDLSTGTLRSLATTEFVGGYWRYDLAMSGALPVVSWFFLVRAVRRPLGRDAAVFGVFFLLASLAAVASLLKAPLVLYLVLTLVVGSMARGRERPSPMAVVAVLFAIFMLAAMLYRFLMSGQGLPLWENMARALNRILVGQVYPGLFYMDYFPAHESFLLGRGLPNPAGLLPHTPVVVAREIWAHYFPHDAAFGNQQGNVNTMFLFSAFANFGWLGAGIYACVAGGIVTAAPRCLELLTRPAPELYLPLFALLCRESLRLSVTSLEQTLLSVPMMLLVVMFASVGVAAKVIQGVVRSDRQIRTPAPRRESGRRSP